MVSSTFFPMIRKECLTFICVTFSVNELSDGNGWKTLAVTVCIYVLLKFMQGGGAGTDPWRKPWRKLFCHWSAFTTFCYFSSSQVPLALLATCALSCGSGCSSTPTVWSRCASSPTCTRCPCAGIWAAKPAKCYGALTAGPLPSTAC